jgi:hypothetical protein
MVTFKDQKKTQRWRLRALPPVHTARGSSRRAQVHHGHAFGQPGCQSPTARPAARRDDRPRRPPCLSPANAHLNKCRMTKVRWQSEPTADYARADGKMSGVTTGPAGTSPRSGDSAKTGGGRCRGTACQWCAGGARFCRCKNGAAGSQARKALRRCRQMDAEHADGPETGMRVHGKNRPIESRVATATRWPLSHPRVRRASACIRVRPFLLGCPPHAAASEATVTGTRQPRPHAPGQTGVSTPAGVAPSARQARPHAPERRRT